MNNVYAALSLVFPLCTKRKLKLLRSKAVDVAQITHTDYVPPGANFRSSHCNRTNQLAQKGKSQIFPFIRCCFFVEICFMQEDPDTSLRIADYFCQYLQLLSLLLRMFYYTSKLKQYFSKSLLIHFPNPNPQTDLNYC